MTNRPPRIQRPTPLVADAGADAGVNGAAAGRDARGYRVEPGPGPRVRTDVIDVYVMRREHDGHSPSRGEVGVSLARSEEFSLLQVHRAKEPLGATWQPVMGHIEHGETAVRAAVREVEEEIGLVARDEAWRGMWALEQVHPYFLPALDCIVMSPRFLVEVSSGWTPRLNDEHDGFRWVHCAQAWRHFMWPGQQAAITEITEFLMPAGSLSRKWLKV